MTETSTIKRQGRWQQQQQQQYHCNYTSPKKFGIVLSLVIFICGLLGTTTEIQARQQPKRQLFGSTSFWKNNLQLQRQQQQQQSILTEKTLTIGTTTTFSTTSETTATILTKSLLLLNEATTKFDSNKILFKIRGGSDEDEDDEDEYDVEDEDEDEEETNEGSDEEEEDDGGNAEAKSVGTIDVSGVLEKAGTISKKVLVIFGKVIVKTAKAVKRGVEAGIRGEDDADDGKNDKEPTTITIKIFKTIKRMIKATFTPPTAQADPTNNADSSDNDNDNGDVVIESPTKTTKKGKKKSSTTTEKPETIDKKEPVKVKADVIETGTDGEGNGESSYTPPTVSKTDFGTFLSKLYGVPDQRGESGPVMLGGALSDALALARSQARLLVIFIPASKAPSKGKKSKDQIAIESLLSSEVAKTANKRALKDKQGMGSFLLWGARMGSSEATAAIKRLKVQTTSTKGEKRPILAVVYPRQVLDAIGVRVVPSLLGQHHCNPPPAPELMSGWLNSLRKRHAKQYRTMQTQLNEIQYLKERKQGYSESVQNDLEREQREKEEAAKRAAEEQAEKERKEAIEARRKELKESLPKEDNSRDAKKLAIRFADGRSGQRRFSPDEKLSTVFNWVDAMFEMEREKVVLTTMNGKQTFQWNEETNEQTLAEAGLGKMAGFRVSEAKEDTEETSSEDSDKQESS